MAIESSYNLTILNQNSQFQQFALYQTLPDIVGPSNDPLSLAWLIGTAAAGSQINPSQSVMTWNVAYSASTGYIRSEGTDSSPRSFLTSTTVSVGVDTQNLLSVDYQGNFPNGAPGFSGAPTDGAAGEVSITASGLIPTALQQQSVKMSLNIGLAMDGKPTVVTQLLPNQLYQFTPKPKYFLLSGAFIPGQVIDTARTTQAFEVDYDGLTNRTVIFTEQNQFAYA